MIKQEIQDSYIKAINEDLPPNVFADEILKLFYIKKPDFNAVIDPHYDSKGRLEGGYIIQDGICVGHADPHGEEGAMGIQGVN